MNKKNRKQLVLILLACMSVSIAGHAAIPQKTAEIIRNSKVYDMNKNKNQEPLPQWTEQAWRFLTHKGIKPVQASAIVANLMAESRGNPLAANPLSGATGIQQWLGPRKVKLRELYGDNPSIYNQMEFLVDEHNGIYPGFGWNFKGQGRHVPASGYYQYGRQEFEEAGQPEMAAIAWNQGFGRPGRHELHNGRRAQWARKIFNAYASPPDDDDDDDDGLPEIDGWLEENEPAFHAERDNTGVRIAPDVTDDHERELWRTGAQARTQTPLHGAQTDGTNAQYRQQQQLLQEMQQDRERQEQEKNFLLSLIAELNKPVHRRSRSNGSHGNG
jgi:hypothetical protein